MTAEDVGTNSGSQTGPEIMKSLALGIVGDLGRLLRDQELGRRPVRIIEAMVFAMFVVTEAFATSRQVLDDEAKAQLDLFHEDMVTHMLQEYFYKHQKARDREEVEGKFNQLNDLINQRYQEYRQKFWDDYQKKELSFAGTFGALFQHLFPDPLEDEAQKALLQGMGVKLARFWSGCFAALGPQAGQPPAPEAPEKPTENSPGA